MNVPAALAFVALSIGGLLASRARNGEYVTPGSVLVAAWSLSFGLYLLRMLPYGPMSAGAAATLGLGVASIAGGILLGRRLARCARPPVVAAASPQAWLTAYGLAGVAGLGWYLFEVHRYVGLHAIFEKGYEIRLALGQFYIPSRFLFLELFSVVTPLVALAMRLSGLRIRPWHWGLVAVCVAGTWITTDRTQFFTLLLTGLFMFLYRQGPRLSWRRFALALTVCGAMLVSNFLIVGAWTGKSPQRMGLSLTMPKATAGAGAPSVALLAPLLKHGSTIYLYTTGSYAGFAAWYPLEHERTYGLHAIYPVVRALERAGALPFRAPKAIPGFVPILSMGDVQVGWNGFTLLYYPLLDFGLAGVFVYCLAIGVASGAVYQLARGARDNPLYLLALSQITLALALSIFVNKFNETAAWYILLWTTAPFWVRSWLHRGLRLGRRAD